MTITTQDQFAAAQLNPLMRAPISRASATTVANRMHSTWLLGTLPAAGATPTGTPGAIPDKTTAGALANFPAITAGLVGYADCGSLTNTTVSNIVMILDRLWAVAGLNGTLTTAQTCGSTTPTRGDVVAYSNVQGFIEVYTALGATPATATVSYTNGTGTAGRTATVSIPASAPAGALFPIPLQAGDQSIRSIQTVTLSVSTGTAGSFGVTLARPISEFGVGLVGAKNDITNIGQFVENSCLWAVVVPVSTASGVIQGSMKLLQG